MLLQCCTPPGVPGTVSVVLMSLSATGQWLTRPPTVWGDDNYRQIFTINMRLDLINSELIFSKSIIFCPQTMCSYWGLQVTFFFVSGSYCTQSLVLLSFLNPKWYWINLCVYWLKNCSKWIILIEGLVQNWSSETSNETTLGLSIHSLPMALYNKLVGRLECHVRAPLFFVLLMNFPTDLGVLFWHAQVWVSCHRLRPPAPSSSLFPSFSIWSLCLPMFFVYAFSPTLCLTAGCLSVHSPMSVSCFPPSLILVASCWASPSWCEMTTNKKKKPSFPPFLSPVFQTGINT